jgi:1-deoxy-D-xylulose-5-phosphate synthase
MGGAGSAVIEALQDAGVNVPVLRLGVPDIYTDHGDPQTLLSQMGLDATGIETAVRQRFGSVVTSGTPAKGLKLVG